MSSDANAKTNTPLMLLRIGNITTKDDFNEIHPKLDQVVQSKDSVRAHRRMNVDWDSKTRNVPETPMSISMTEFESKDAFDKFSHEITNDSTMMEHRGTFDGNPFLLAPEDPDNCPHRFIEKIASQPGQVIEFAVRDTTTYGEDFDAKEFKSQVAKVFKVLGKDEYKYAFVGGSVWSAINKPGVIVLVMVFSSLDAYKDLLPVGRKIQEEDFALVRNIFVSYPTIYAVFATDVNHRK